MFNAMAFAETHATNMEIIMKVKEKYMYTLLQPKSCFQTVEHKSQNKQSGYRYVTLQLYSQT